MEENLTYHERSVPLPLPLSPPTLLLPLLISFSPDDKQLTSVGEDGNIFIWNIFG